MTDYQKQIAEALPDSLNSQHRQVLAEAIERAFVACGVGAIGAFLESSLDRATRFSATPHEIQCGLAAGIKALRGDG